MTKGYNGTLGNSGYSLKEALRDTVREHPMVWRKGPAQITPIFARKFRMFQIKIILPAMPQVQLHHTVYLPKSFNLVSWIIFPSRNIFPIYSRN